LLLPKNNRLARLLNNTSGEVFKTVGLNANFLVLPDEFAIINGKWSKIVLFGGKS